MLGRLLLGSLAAVFLAAPFARAQDDDVRKTLYDATELYKQGKYKESYQKFEEALQKQPSNDLVYAYMKRVGEDVVASMMNSKDADMKRIGYRLFELAKPVGERQRSGKKTVTEYIEALRDNDLAVQMSARWHLQNIGPYAARFLVPYLGHGQEDLFRSRIILTLTGMGTDVSLAVAEALHSKNPTMRRNAAVVLGNIKDDRTVPALRRAQLNANETPEVKKLAAEALIKITRQGEDQWKDAKEYYFDLAENLYNQSPAAVHVWNRAWLVWRWDEEKDTLTEREVPRFAWSHQVAEEALHDALALDPEYKRDAGSPHSLLACVHFQQAIDAENALAAAEAALKGNDPGFLPDHLETLKKWMEGAERNLVAAKTVGRNHLYEALARCLRDGNAQVAVEILETLRTEGRAEDLPAAGSDAASSPGGSVILALTHEDKRVRYAAAGCYAALNPKEQRLGHQLVIQSLVDALGESGVRTALVIYDVQDDADRTYINSLKKILEQANLFVDIAPTGGEGVVKAKRFPTEDVILIQRKVAGQIYFKEEPTSRKRIVETVFDTLRDDVRTRSIPRVLLADSPAELEESKTTFGATAQGWILKNAGLIEFRGMFEQLFKSPEAQKDSKDRADRLALAAADTLASIDPTNTHLEYKEAVDALIKTVDPTVLRADPIRLSAARALGRFGDQRAIDVLSKALAMKSEDPEQAKGQASARVQFAKSLAWIFRTVQMAPSKDVYDNLKKQLTDGDLAIESATAEALGNCDLTPVQRVEVERERRVNTRRAAKTPDDE
ncbi:MAG TPA: HEAT repeat domain-containing protein [Planctomycetota bacterium]|nr:HEAT repeat domain-containing protein [Planctomycetota bacterium]